MIYSDLQVQKASPQCHFAFDSTYRKKSPLVLLAENDEETRDALKTLLDLYDVDVLEAQSGEETIDLTVRARPDLILINTELPRLDGFEAVRLIRKIKSLDDTPIIFLSLRIERSFRKKAFSVGADSFHIAPLDFERLDNILENFLFRQNKFPDLKSES